MADKNLFLYDLAVVAIMKNEGHYIKEWLDYHLLAGADHFYIYDNESPDNMKEILQPYIDKNIVTYIFYPGKSPQFPAYNDAINKYKFFCRYMAFIDGDEFILPGNNKTITETVDEILSDKPYAGALSVSRYTFGSNNHKTADYTKPVLERFTRRANIYKPAANDFFIKDIVIPRHTDFFDCPHKINHFEGYVSVDENGKPVFTAVNASPSYKKIVVNHYHTKSREEYLSRNNRGDAVYTDYSVNEEKFNNINATANEIFDDSILKYRDKLIKDISRGGYLIRQPDYNKISSALIYNLSPMFTQNTAEEFFKGKMETFLTCRAVSSYLREKFFDKTTADFFEELSLKAVYKTFFTALSIADIKLLISELPKILPLNYSVAENIRTASIKIISQLQTFYRNRVETYDILLWRKYYELENLLQMLNIYSKK